MSAYRIVKANGFLLIPVFSFLLASPAWGHVLLLAPNGGEDLEVGSVFIVRWQVTGGNYNPQNWDLWYSTMGSSGPWTTLATNLAAGSGAVGSVHTYDWTVPNVVDDTVWVRVRMDNYYTDYYDVSNGPFSIVLPCPADLDGDGVVDAADLAELLASWGPCEGCPADFNGDGVVDAADLADLLAAWGPCE